MSLNSIIRSNYLVLNKSHLIILSLHFSFLIHTSNSLEKVTAYYHHDNIIESYFSYLILQINIHRYNSSRKWKPSPIPNLQQPKSFQEKSTNTHKKGFNLQTHNFFQLYILPKSTNESERRKWVQVRSTAMCPWIAWAMRTKAYFFSFSVQCVWWTLRTQRPWTFICKVYGTIKDQFFLGLLCVGNSAEGG